VLTCAKEAVRRDRRLDSHADAFMQAPRAPGRRSTSTRTTAPFIEGLAYSESGRGPSRRIDAGGRSRQSMRHEKAPAISAGHQSLRPFAGTASPPALCCHLQRQTTSGSHTIGTGGIGNFHLCVTSKLMRRTFLAPAHMWWTLKKILRALGSDDGKNTDAPSIRSAIGTWKSNGFRAI